MKQLLRTGVPVALTCSSCPSISASFASNDGTPAHPPPQAVDSLHEPTTHHSPPMMSHESSAHPPPPLADSQREPVSRQSQPAGPHTSSEQPSWSGKSNVVLSQSSKEDDTMDIDGPQLHSSRRSCAAPDALSAPVMTQSRAVATAPVASAVGKRKVSVSVS